MVDKEETTMLPLGIYSNCSFLPLVYFEYFIYSLSFNFTSLFFLFKAISTWSVGWSSWNAFLFCSNCSTSLSCMCCSIWFSNSLISGPPKTAKNSGSSHVKLMESSYSFERYSSNLEGSIGNSYSLWCITFKDSIGICLISPCLTIKNFLPLMKTKVYRPANLLMKLSIVPEWSVLSTSEPLYK